MCRKFFGNGRSFAECTGPAVEDRDVVGWVPVGGWSNLAWWANPILFFAWGKILVSRRSPDVKQKRYAACLSYIALALAFSFFLAKTVVTNEGGVPVIIERYEWGYWFWLSSMACCAACTTINLFHNPNQ